MKYFILIVIILTNLILPSQSFSKRNSEYERVIHQSTQCNGKTQKGIQCKRFVSNGENYCYQHLSQKSGSKSKPAEPSSERINSKPSSESPNQSYSQCKGTTKKGNQCKRMVKSSNGYCYQHGG
jgi:hypothetical protein